MAVKYSAHPLFSHKIGTEQHFLNSSLRYIIFVSYFLCIPALAFLPLQVDYFLFINTFT